jgi:hypothetical protein
VNELEIELPIRDVVDVGRKCIEVVNLQTIVASPRPYDGR